jgi:tetratricopeptide (TPR) repeat protein
MRSFAICYRDYPNRTPKVRAAGNIYHKRALLRWGDAARGAGDYAAAARLYKKFLAERDPRRDKVSMPDIYSKLSICYSKIGKIPEAAKSLEIALKARRAYRFAKLRGVRQRL